MEKQIIGLRVKTFFNVIQGVNQRFLLGRNPPFKRPSGRRFGGDKMIRVAVFKQIPVQRTIEFGQGRVIGVFGRNRGNKAVSAFSSVDRPSP